VVEGDGQGATVLYGCAGFLLPTHLIYSFLAGRNESDRPDRRVGHCGRVRPSRHSDQDVLRRHEIVAEGGKLTTVA
jgi:hypothetical protein